MPRSRFLAICLVGLLASTAQTEALDPARVCAAAQAPGFADRLAHMAGGGEGCAQDRCLDRPVLMGKRTYVEVADDPLYPGFAASAGPIVEEAATLVADATGVDFGASFDDADSFLFFLVVSPDMEGRIMRGEVEGIDPQLFQTYIAPALRAPACSGIATHVGGEPSRLLHHAIIFVPEAIVGGVEETRKCVLEELMNAAGLLRDPPGSASLFDGGNFRLANGRLTYSEETLAMLTLHYDIAQGKFQHVDDFLSSQCGIPSD